MRAAVLVAPRTCRVIDAPLPQPGPGEVRLRVEGCGVCASDLPVWDGRPWFTYPREAGAPGHEGWGTIDALGAGVSGLDPGQRVAAVSFRAYAEYDIARADAVVKLPPDPAGRPFPGEPLGCAVNVMARSDIRPEHTVAVVGVGFLGALLVGLASGAGARVIAVSRRPFALEAAARLGAAAALPLDDPRKIVEEVMGLTGGRGCDRVIEATGRQGPLELAGELVRVRGRLIVAGYHQDGDRRINLQLWNWRGLDVINAHERDPEVYVSGIRGAVEMVEAGLLRPETLYTHRFGLEEISEAFRLMRERPDGFLKGLILP